MTALLKANRITALPSSYKPLQYLRRSTSICGQRTPENFTHHIPLQLQTFFTTVMQENDKGEETRQKLKMAKEFIQRKINLYRITLTTLIQTKVYSAIPQETLTIYLQKAQELKK